MTKTPSKIDDHAPHILVVDDDKRIRLLLERYLNDQGFRVTSMANANEARGALAGLIFDCLILDVMMPGEDGFELLNAIRNTIKAPILMLTARSEADHRIEGLELGADDYLSKPFEPRELVLRIKNLIQRIETTPQEQNFITFGEYHFDLSKKTLSSKNKNIHLTEKERMILEAFAYQPNKTISRDALTKKPAMINERSIDVQINRLRKKIETNPTQPLYLQTVRGIGYKLCTD